MSRNLSPHKGDCSERVALDLMNQILRQELKHPAKRQAYKRDPRAYLRELYARSLDVVNGAEPDALSLAQQAKLDRQAKRKH